MLFRPRPAKRMDALVRAYVELGRFSGAVLVARGDTVLFSEGYGQADQERGLPNTPATAFRIGSQTKTFTAIDVLLLQERGLLRVSDPLAAYLPGYPGGDRITLHHLLTNTSGIPDYITAEGFTRVMGTRRTRQEVIASFRDLPPLFPPGERMSYSNSGWVLLGEVIERVSRRPYGHHLRERVLAPLGMERTGLDVTHDVATGYMSVDGRFAPTPHLDDSNQDAAGALRSSVEDLHRWQRGLWHGGLLRPDSLAALTHAHVTAEDGSYGYGCLVSPDRIESSGGTIGFVSVSMRHPRDDLFVTVLSNIENGAYAEIGHGLAAIARDEPYEPPSARVFVTVDPGVFQRYLGRYAMRYMGRSSTMDVTQDGDHLVAEVHGLARTELRPMSPTRYFASMKGEVELEFAADGSHVLLNWAGHPVRAERVSRSPGSSPW
uniref:serine hydrolase domain-containing protein n=1 Tax=Nonomuraea pusilla TaxID=46177 RepID=UPI0006E27282|nr:serine hydrolase domain-containing protein [Nonomuraea pusilla]